MEEALRAHDGAEVGGERLAGLWRVHLPANPEAVEPVEERGGDDDRGARRGDVARELSPALLRRRRRHWSLCLSVSLKKEAGFGALATYCNYWCMSPVAVTLKS
eukprot:4762071-Prymnesium_polylepis.1